MSNVEIGDQFRDQIRYLISLAGWKSDTERLVGGKKADLIFARNDFGRPTWLAVEAKNWGRALKLRDLETIVGAYSAAHSRGEIESLWIVAPQPLAGGKEFIDAQRWVRFFTMETLLRSLMDFNQYLNDLIYEHEESGVENYFISPQARPSDEKDEGKFFDLHAHIESWIAGDDNRPIAVVEGYGTGKTTAAQHVVYSLAKRFQSFSAFRIPIYVELGRLTNQQKLSGLFGTLMLDDHRVDGYSWALFKRMNQMGCFVVVLDGFDEMKHLMTRADFEYNFRELNKLVDGKAKVILLGRPSAFSSEDERQYLLHGKRPLDNEIVRDPSMPDYVEIRLKRFSKKQVADFVERFLRYKSQTMPEGSTPITEKVIQTRLKEIMSHDYGDLLERPVQVRMLAEIATVYNKPLGNLNRYKLYERFMDDLIQREMEKDARQGFTSEERRQFCRELSWWMWKSNKTLGIRLSEIPDELFSAHIASGAPLEAIRRDLVSASFFDEKESGQYIVPHRSMIEFMVAEHVVTLASQRRVDAAFIRGAADLLTADVMNYVFESSKQDFALSVSEILTSYHGHIPDAFLGTLSTANEIISSIKSIAVSKWSPWHMRILANHYDHRIRKANPTLAWSEFTADLNEYLKEHRSDPVALLCSVLGLMQLLSTPFANQAAQAIMELILRNVALGRLNFGMNARNEAQPVILKTDDLDGQLVDAVRLSVKSTSKDGVLYIQIAFAPFALRLGALMAPKYVLSGDLSRRGAWPIGSVPEMIELPYNSLFNKRVEQSWEVLRKFMSIRPRVVIQSVK